MTGFLICILTRGKGLNVGFIAMPTPSVLPIKTEVPYSPITLCLKTAGLTVLQKPNKVETRKATFFF
jgi:hypothetical protein